MTDYQPPAAVDWLNGTADMPVGTPAWCGKAGVTYLKASKKHRFYSVEQSQ